MNADIITPSSAAHALGDDGRQSWELTTLTPVSKLAFNPSDSQLRERTGHWARIEADDSQVRLYTDRLMSFPLYYARRGERWVVGTNIYEVAHSAHAERRSSERARELLNCAHTLADETLYAGVFAAPAGARVTLSGAEAQVHYWGIPAYRSDDLVSADEFGTAFDAALTDAFANSVSAAGSHQIAIPLSGGIDSRLLVMYLRKVGAQNLVAFTYGKPGSREVETSRAVAQKMGIPWHAVELNPEVMRVAWAGPEGHSFRRHTWSGFALPHVQDWWALHHLRQEGVLHPGDIVFPGHTIVGNMHHLEILDRPWERSAIARALVGHHWCLRTKTPSSPTDWELLKRALGEAIAETGWQLRPGDEDVEARRRTQSLVEWFNLKHRQAKYINNSMRAYEHFDLNWALPMLDAQVWNIWFRGSEELTAERDWYREFTDGLWEQHTGEETRYFEPANTAMNAKVKAALLAGMRATGADRALSKARSVRSQVDHPMAFEAFATGLSKAQLAAELLRGRTQMGVWTQLFLDNHWGSTEPVVPQ